MLIKPLLDCINPCRFSRSNTNKIYFFFQICPCFFSFYYFIIQKIYNGFINILDIHLFCCFTIESIIILQYIFAHILMVIIGIVIGETYNDDKYPDIKTEYISIRLMITITLSINQN